MSVYTDTVCVGVVLAGLTEVWMRWLLLRFIKRSQDMFGGGTVWCGGKGVPLRAHAVASLPPRDQPHDGIL